MERKSELHRIADEQVDYYRNNDLFIQYVEDYYKTKKLDKHAWLIAFQCACNFLKKRKGKYWSYEQIEDLAMDLVTVLFSRIKSKEYHIANLPSVLEQIYLTVYYNAKAKKERQVLSLDTEIEKIMEKEYGE